MNTFHSALPFAYSPEPGVYSSPHDYRAQGQDCINLPKLLQRTNDLNVPFSNHAYNNAKMCCNWDAKVGQKYLLPKWPVQGSSRMYPVIDRTVDRFPVNQPYWEDGVNAYRDVLTDRVSPDGRWMPGPAEIIARQPCVNVEPVIDVNTMKAIQVNFEKKQATIANVLEVENRQAAIAKVLEVESKQAEVVSVAKSQVHIQEAAATPVTHTLQKYKLPTTKPIRKPTPKKNSNLENRKDQSLFQNLKEAVKGAAEDVKKKGTLPEKNKFQYVCTRNDRICYFLFILLLLILSILIILIIVKFLVFICR